MQDSAGLAAVRRLPPSAVAGLRAAFAAEVAERVPRLQSAVVTRSPDAVRDAHSLGSSAAVVGEQEASRCARAAEQHLLDGDWDDAARCVAELAAHLDGWAP